MLALCITCCLTAQSKDEIRLLVRADDMGSFASANQACLDAATKGIVRSIEVMVPAAWFPEAAKLLNENPSIDVGVHLVLTSEWENCKWRPLTHAKSLTDKDGYFYQLIWARKDMPGCSLQEARWDIHEIEAEFRAQIETAKKCIRNLTHISTHMGCAEWNEDIKSLLLNLAKEYNLYWQANSPWEYFPKMNASSTDSPEKRINAFIEALGKLQRGKTYLFVEHPAYNTPEMQTVGMKGYMNVAEDRAGIIRIFTDERVKKYIKEKGIRLVSYGELTSSQRSTVREK